MKKIEKKIFLIFRRGGCCTDLSSNSSLLPKMKSLLPPPSLCICFITCIHYLPWINCHKFSYIIGRQMRHHKPRCLIWRPWCFWHLLLVLNLSVACTLFGFSFMHTQLVLVSDILGIRYIGYRIYWVSEILGIRNIRYQVRKVKFHLVIVPHQCRRYSTSINFVAPVPS